MPKFNITLSPTRRLLRITFCLKIWGHRGKLNFARQKQIRNNAKMGAKRRQTGLTSRAGEQLSRHAPFWAKKKAALETGAAGNTKWSAIMLNLRLNFYLLYSIKRSSKNSAWVCFHILLLSLTVAWYSSTNRLAISGLFLRVKRAYPYTIQLLFLPSARISLKSTRVSLSFNSFTIYSLANLITALFWCSRSAGEPSWTVLATLAASVDLSSLDLFEDLSAVPDTEPTIITIINHTREKILMFLFLLKFLYF